MNKWTIEDIEWAGVLVIILIQIYIFTRTYFRIRQFRNVFEQAGEGAVVNLHVPLRDLKEKSPADIFQNWNKYRDDGKVGTDDQPRQLNIIVYPKIASSTFSNITESLNTYLLKNRGAATDFHLIKDIVERNTESLDEDISHTISLPLYLGLLGTFMGIVFGLFQMNESFLQSSEESLDQSIGILLGGVKIAMIASFSGLLLTIINNGWIYKSARVVQQTGKNEFYTFIQTELLPVIDQSINTTLYSLQTNLSRFNETFGDNVEKLSTIMNKNYDSLKAQEHVLDSLEKIDITQFAKANVTILKELNTSVSKFEDFNKYMAQTNTMLYGTKVIVQKVNEFIERTEEFQGLAKKANETFEFSHELQQFLKNHYSSLENAQQVFDNKLATVNEVLFSSLDQLKEFTGEKIREINRIMAAHLDQLNTVYPEKLNKLDHLAHLENMRNHLNDIKMTSAGQLGSLKSQVVDMNDRMKDLVAEVKSQNQKKHASNGRVLGFLWKKRRRA